jgi:hypothetical protein
MIPILTHACHSCEGMVDKNIYQLRYCGTGEFSVSNLSWCCRLQVVALVRKILAYVPHMHGHLLVVGPPAKIMLCIEHPLITNARAAQSLIPITD